MSWNVQVISFTFNLRFKKKMREHKNGEHLHTGKVIAAGAFFFYISLTYIENDFY